MVTFIIGTYEVMVFAGKGQVVRVYMNDDSGTYRGYIDFIEGYAGTQNFVQYPNGIVNAFMPLTKLQAVLDVLRNEKPVYFSVNPPYNWAALKTGREPTGEEESRAA